MAGGLVPPGKGGLRAALTRLRHAKQDTTKTRQPNNARTVYRQRHMDGTNKPETTPEPLTSKASIPPTGSWLYLEPRESRQQPRRIEAEKE